MPFDDALVYGLDDIAELTGYHAKHLTRKDGPIARVLETYFWQKDELSPDGKSLTESGLSLLNDYLYNCGKGGTMSYQDWQQSIWEENGKFPGQEETPEQTAIIPLVEVSSYDLAPLPEFMPDFDNIQSQFSASIEQMKTANFQRGQQLAREVTMPIVEGFRTEQKEILTKMLQALNGG